MFTFFRPFYSALSALALCPALAFAQSNTGIKVIDHDKDIKKASVAAIDTEHFEIAAFTGLLAVEDFNTNPVFGIAFKYYVSPSFFIEANTGNSSTEKSNVEGNRNFIFERDFEYFGLVGGYKLVEGRSFWGKKRKFNTGLFLLGGVENVDFNEESETGYVLGASYKTVLTDAIAVNLDFRNHIVNRTLQGDEKTTINPEVSLGISTFF